MISSKAEYLEYLKQDMLANRRTKLRPAFFGDELWKFQRTLRKREYYASFGTLKKKLFFLPIMMNRLSFKRRALQLGFSIPPGVFGKGLALPHYGTIVVSGKARVGENCRIHEGVNIGATNGNEKAPVIGNNVFIGTGAKIIGEVTVADDVAIGANAVVVKSIAEPGTTWAGIPARKISDNSSRSNLANELFL